MPNIVAHYICGKLVAKKLRISDKKYLQGNLYPDYVNKKRHYRILGRKFEIPDINKFIREERIENKLFKIGFLTHLMLDKLFLDDFVINNIYTKIDDCVNIFEKDKIYKDYTNMSKKLLKHYNLNINEIENIILPESKYIDIQKYKNNIDTIKESSSEELKYIDLNNFIDFLDAASQKIYTYIKREKYYN